ncbi:MAG: glycosyltransferase [Saprospiraceae bacterium]
MAIEFVLIFLAFVYAGLMVMYWYGWKSSSEFVLPEVVEDQIRVSIVVAARNEADHIMNCLASILNCSYNNNLMQLILVDDFSDDQTYELANSFLQHQTERVGGRIDFQLIRLNEIEDAGKRFSANKKLAIESAIERATGDLIVCTDADCMVPKNWLKTITSYFTRNPEVRILSAPVLYHNEKNLLQWFQSLDILGLMGITASGYALGLHSMGNGANLAYWKSAFEEVGGYAGNRQIPSGDDMFLLHKMHTKWPGSAHFLKSQSAIVSTEAKATFQAFWHQRLRWGTKNAAMPDWPMRLILLAVWFFCTSVFIAAILVGTGTISWKILALQLSFKLISDWIFLREVCQFFDRKELLHWFLPSFFMHTFYISSTGLASLVKRSYDWKGQQVKF